MGEEALDGTERRTGFGSGYVRVVRETTQWIHEIVSLSAA